MVFLFISTSRSFIANYTLDGFFEKILRLTYILKFHTEIRNNMSLLVAKVEMLRDYITHCIRKTLTIPTKTDNNICSVFLLTKNTIMDGIISGLLNGFSANSALSVRKTSLATNAAKMDTGIKFIHVLKSSDSSTPCNNLRGRYRVKIAEALSATNMIRKSWLLTNLTYFPH